MGGVIEKILAYLPNYLTDFGALVRGPKTHMLSIDLEKSGALLNALVFAAITLIIAQIAQWGRYAGKAEFWEVLATGAIVTAVGVILFSLVTMMAWRLVGWRAPAKTVFITLIYFQAVAMLIHMFFALIAIGLSRVFAADTYAHLTTLAAENQVNIFGMTQDTIKFSEVDATPFERTMLMFSGVLNFLGLFVALAWIIAGWGFFRIVGGATRARSVVAFLIVLLLTYPIIMILYLIGSTMVKL